MDQFQWLDIDILEDERPVIARLMVGTVGATALMMVAGIIWATSDASIASMIFAAIGIAVASFLIIATALPLQCTIGNRRKRSFTCRLQGQRKFVDAIAVILTVIVLGFLVSTA
jgi:hypothetical protein